MSEMFLTAPPLTRGVVELARRVAWAGHKFDVDDRWDRRPVGLVAQVTRMGRGNFSRVYSLPGYDDLVVKVGGRSAYGTGHSRPYLYDAITDDSGQPALDQWPTYIDWVAREHLNEPWVPRVHHFEKLRSARGSLYFAVMEKLSPAYSLSCPSHLRWLVRWQAEELGVHMDLHCDNYMRRPGTKQVVITDPWSGAGY